MMNVDLKKGNSAESKTIVKATDTLFSTGSVTINTAQVTIDEIGTLHLLFPRDQTQAKYRRYWEML
jgi:hypothetical protein